jgi:hypothetical protein
MAKSRNDEQGWKSMKILARRYSLNARYPDQKRGARVNTREPLTPLTEPDFPTTEPE